MKSPNQPYVKQYDSMEAYMLDQCINPITKDKPFVFPTYPFTNSSGITENRSFPNRQQRRASNRIKNNRAHNDGIRVQEILLIDGNVKLIYHRN